MPLQTRRRPPDLAPRISRPNGLVVHNLGGQCGVGAQQHLGGDFESFDAAELGVFVRW